MTNMDTIIRGGRVVLRDRVELLDIGIEIASSFGRLKGKIWRIGTMGYSCRRKNVLHVLGALEAVLLRQKFVLPAGEAVRAGLDVYKGKEGALC